MSTTIVGLYDEYNTANKVVDRLKKSDVNNDHIHVNAHDDRHTSSDYDTDDLGRHLRDDGVPEEDARLYAEGVRRGGTLVIVEASDRHAERVADIMNEGRPVDVKDRHADWKERGYTGKESKRERYTEEQVKKEREHTLDREARRSVGEGADEATLKEAREELRVGKRQTSSGTVRLHKRVEERPVEETVTLHQEEVDVQKREGRGTGAAGDVFEERTVEMTERHEEPVVEKETKVTGEVVARKRERDEKETVRDTVRETKVDVDKSGGGTRTTDRGFEAHADTYRRHHKEHIGTGDYSTYEPAYRFGHEHGTHDDYRGKKWSEARPALRKNYEAQHGEGTFEDVKEAIRYGYRNLRRGTGSRRS